MALYLLTWWNISFQELEWLRPFLAPPVLLSGMKNRTGEGP